MKNRDKIDRPDDGKPASEQGTWIIRPRRVKKHDDQMRLPLDDVRDDVDVTRLSDEEFRILLLGEGDDLGIPVEDRPDQNASAWFRPPLTEQEWQEVLEELDRVVAEMLAELDSGQ